jgi:hypothetical protein
MSDRVYHLSVLALTDNGDRCSTGEGEAFWLPRNSVKWHSPPTTGKTVSATIPEWLAEKHRQLVGDDAFEAAKRRKQIDVAREVAKPLGLACANARDMSGVLFRNQQRERQPARLQRGRDHSRREVAWPGWIKEGKSGKFLRLDVSDEKPA